MPAFKELQINFFKEPCKNKCFYRERERESAETNTKLPSYQCILGTTIVTSVFYLALILCQPLY